MSARRVDVADLPEPIHIGWGILALACLLALLPPLRDVGLFLMPFAVGYIMGLSTDV